MLHCAVGEIPSTVGVTYGPSLLMTHRSRFCFSPYFSFCPLTILLPCPMQLTYGQSPFGLVVTKQKPPLSSPCFVSWYLLFASAIFGCPTGEDSLVSGPSVPMEELAGGPDRVAGFNSPRGDCLSLLLFGTLEGTLFLLVKTAPFSLLAFTPKLFYFFFYFRPSQTLERVFWQMVLEWV